MADLPYMKFFPADWLADCDVLSMSARGAWITFICKAWQARSGSVTLKIAQWSRVFGATNAEQAERVIAEIEDCEVGEVMRDACGRITLASKRIQRDLDAMGVTAKKKSEAARKAAEKRWEKEKNRKDDAPGIPDACESHTDSNADAMRGDAIPESRIQNPDIETNVSCPAPPDVLQTIWPLAPPSSRERSSKKQVLDELKRLKTNERPPLENLIQSLHDWNQTEKWQSGYAEGLHLWVKRRQWENKPTPAAQKPKTSSPEVQL